MNQQQLPQRQVEEIFSTMACLYGRRFVEMWEGQQPSVVKAFWGRKLAGFAEYPQAIAQALESLDDRNMPPTLPEFVGLCRQALKRVGSGRLMLDVKPVPKERAAEILAEAKQRFWFVKRKADEKPTGGCDAAE